MMNPWWNNGTPVLLDGAMGTMLQQHGLQPGQTPEAMNLTSPDILIGIHRAYMDAGSQVIYANTFGANAYKLARSGLSVEEVVHAGVAAARAAAQGTQAHVGLDVGPIGTLLEPLGTMTFEEAYDLFAQVMKAGAEAGAELIVIETMSDLYEAKAALLAAKEQTSLPCWITMSFDQMGRTFTGCTVEAFARTMEGLGADAIGLNCSLGPAQLLPVVRRLTACTRLPVIVKPNAGLPDPDTGAYDLQPEDFASAMREVLHCGVHLLGGCCGTSPAYIEALGRVVAGSQPAQATPDTVSCVCTPTRVVRLDGVRVIGERINPTGKKRLQQALLENDLDYIAQVAIAQADAGADMLDVNVGYPGVDEVAMLPRVVKLLQETVDLPLQLDSSNAEALEAGLRVVNGKAAVNSVNGDPAVLDKLLPIVRKYGAAVIGLTLDQNGIPPTAQARVDIARRILQAAQAHGIPREDVWIDCLTLTVSAQQEQAEETLSALHTVRHELGLQTVLGVSNISFGLPNRLLMTQVFLLRALHAGLTLPIINPNQKELMDAIAAYRVLSGEDVSAQQYIARFSQQAESKPAPVAEGLTLYDAIRRGLKAEASRLAEAALAEASELSVVEGTLIPALDAVGSDYERGVVFLPQLLSAAQAAQAVFEAVAASLSRKGAAPVRKGRMAIATVKGDVHDIGKNIVRTVLENYGYDVLDLGRDVPPEEIVRAVEENGLGVVGLSALMTTTLPAMEATIRLLRQLPHAPFIIVGGAVLTPEYAAQIGADAYAKDARATVEIVRKVLNA